MDISRDGGNSWAGWQDTVYNYDGQQTTDWSYPEYDGKGFWVRGCINVNGISVCTPWH